MQIQSLVTFSFLVMLASKMALDAQRLTGPDGDGSHVEFYHKFGALNDAGFFNLTNHPNGYVCEINTKVNSDTSTMTMGDANKESRKCYFEQNYCLLCVQGFINKEEDFYKCDKAIDGAVLMSPDSMLKMNRTTDTCSGVSSSDHVAIDIRRYLQTWVVDDWYMNETSVKEWATWGEPTEVDARRISGIHVVLTIWTTRYTLPVLTQLHGDYMNTAYGAICEVNAVNATLLARYWGSDKTIENDWDCLEASGKKHCYYHRKTEMHNWDQERYCQANGGYLFAPSTTAEAKKVIKNFKTKSGFDPTKPLYIGISQICGSYQIANGATPWNNSVWPYWINKAPKFEKSMNLPGCNRIYAHRCKYTPSKCPPDWKKSTVDTFDTNKDIRIVPGQRAPTEPQSDEEAGLSTGAVAGIVAGVFIVLLLVAAVLVLMVRRKPPQSEVNSISSMPQSEVNSINSMPQSKVNSIRSMPQSEVNSISSMPQSEVNSISSMPQSMEMETDLNSNEEPSLVSAA